MPRTVEKLDQIIGELDSEYEKLAEMQAEGKTTGFNAETLGINSGKKFSFDFLILRPAETRNVLSLCYVPTVSSPHLFFLVAIHKAQQEAGGFVQEPDQVEPGPV